MPSKRSSVLIVDDDGHVLRLMQRILEPEGYSVLRATNGEEAMDMLVQSTPDVVLLDIAMPGVDGHTVCRRIREFSAVPVIMVTARGNDQEKVEGLEAGADDYVTKPFSPQELVARVKAVLRRTKLWEERPEAAYQSNDLVVDFVRHRVTLAGQEVKLTGTEYRLLSYLARNAGRVLTPDQTLATVWGEEYVGESHLLQVNVARLRQKLKDDARNPTYIQTRPGLGYLMEKMKR